MSYMNVQAGQASANLEGFSLIIPTYCEVKNIPMLIERIATVNFGNRPFEVLLIDDNSNDGTVELVHGLQKKYPWLRLIVRQQARDLSYSVLEGFREARYPLLITIDADLSHPPEKIPEMLMALTQPGVDLVLGSRYVLGGSMDEIWPLSRKIASRLAAGLAQLILFNNIKDPLSGFVAIRKSTLFAGDSFDFIGWKWGLELMIKCHCKQIREVPIHFSQRQHGKSKLNMKTALLYFQHIQKLALYKIKALM